MTTTWISSSRVGSVIPQQVRLSVPPWLSDAVSLTTRYPTDGAKVRLAIGLSLRNVEAGTGGPFGAVVYGPTHRIIAAGVSCVVPDGCSAAHAELMAYMLAQERMRRWRLNRDEAGEPFGPVTMATSSQPCCQCYGATVWAGIDRLLIGARAVDVQDLTDFDEGPLPEDWIGELTRRGIAVVRDIERDAARAVLRVYNERGGTIY